MKIKINLLLVSLLCLLGNATHSKSDIILSSSVTITPEDFNLIKSIANELNISSTIIVVNNPSLFNKEIGSLVYSLSFSFLHIRPHFLEALSIPEKRFIIGRELLSIDNILKNEAQIPKYISIYLNLIVASCIALNCFHPLRYMRQPREEIFDLATPNLIPATGLAAIPLLIKFIFSRIGLESRLDIETAIKLNEFDGAISYLTNYQKYYSSENKNYNKRIEALEKAKYKSNKV